MSGWGAALSVAGDLAGSAIQQKFNASQSAKDRQFQERMSNTAYQRAAQDLEKAGLSRVLALGSPATTPSGARSSIDAPKLGSTGIAAASAKQQIALGKASEEFTRQQTLTSEGQNELNRAQARLATANAIAAERLSPAHGAVGDVIESGVNKMKSQRIPTAEDIRLAIPSYVKQGRSLLDSAQSSARSAIDAQVNRAKSWYESAKQRAQDYLQRRKNPKFRRN